MSMKILDNPPLCRDCVNFDFWLEDFMGACKVAGEKRQSLVFGAGLLPIEATEARKPEGKCGLEGKLFVRAKFFKRFINNFRG